MSGLRVLEAITPSRIGGAEVFVADLCERLPEFGAEVELFVPSGRPFVEYAAKRGISSINWKTRGKLDLITVLKLRGLIRKRGIGVAHTHLSTASLLGAFAAKLAGVRSVAHVHGMNTSTCFRYSNKVIAVSEAVKDHLAAQGIAAEKIQVIHNGVDPAKFVPRSSEDAKRELGYDLDAPLLGVFGRLSEEKGQRVAVEAMFLISKEHPDARLVLAGQGKDLDNLKSAADALGIARNVIFAGFMEDIRTLMSACDVVLVPSLKEGFGLAAVEAMALERPVIASAVGGLNEIVAKDETGFLVAPNAPQAITQCALELLDDPSLASNFGRAGRLRVEECFDQQEQMRKVYEVLA